MSEEPPTPGRASPPARRPSERPFASTQDLSLNSPLSRGQESAVKDMVENLGIEFQPKVRMNVTLRNTEPWYKIKYKNIDEKFLREIF